MSSKEGSRISQFGFYFLVSFALALDLIWSLAIICLIAVLSLVVLSRSNRRNPKRIEMEDVTTAATAAVAEETKKASYRYWVRDSKEDADHPGWSPRRAAPVCTYAACLSSV